MAAKMQEALLPVNSSTFVRVLASVWRLGLQGILLKDASIKVG
ncbi:hypothetical protein [Chromohalobacter sp. 296-RDG]|nr:hypothetical protein [Chromohalobacter sp. 296-RDG]